MKQWKKTFALAALPLALAACGGGGGDDNQAADKPTPQPQQNTQTNTTAPTNTALPASVQKYYIGTYSGYADGISLLQTRVLAEGSDLTKISVDGQTYRLPSPADADQKIGNILVYGSPSGQGSPVISPDGQYSYRSFQMSDDTYRYSRIGFLSGSTGQSLFSIGETMLASNMPTVGTALYRGDALVSYRDENYYFLGVERGTVSANVDFGAKRAVVSLQAPSYAGQASANIDGASLTQDDAAIASGRAAYGVFHGLRGEEMSGKYYDVSAGVDSVFVAKQQ